MWSCKLLADRRAIFSGVDNAVALIHIKGNCQCEATNRDTDGDTYGFVQNVRHAHHRCGTFECEIAVLCAWQIRPPLIRRRKNESAKGPTHLSSASAATIRRCDQHRTGLRNIASRASGNRESLCNATNARLRGRVAVTVCGRDRPRGAPSLGYRRLDELAARSSPPPQTSADSIAIGNNSQ